MTERAKATFGIKSWDEAPWHDSRDGRKLTRATVVKTYSGDLEGEGTMQYVMAYASEASAIFVGIERVEGRLAGRSGAFAMKDEGTFEGGVAASSFEIVEGSGTGDLRGIRGRASVDAVKADTQTMTLEYELG
ncbi:MAG TPA: DUF3224 domain-containing protein [Candidatus Limnocylindrales bacterium]|jgi:hypothetical protein|nr:DUF3224 domain-containing protein [Candidatus Limnocylindrales bacterium]